MSGNGSRPRTLFEKVWQSHVVRSATEDAPAVLYIDLHLVHEVTSAAGLHDPARAWSEGAPPGPHNRDHGPQHANNAAQRSRGDSGV